MLNDENSTRFTSASLSRAATIRSSSSAAEASDCSACSSTRPGTTSTSTSPNVTAAAERGARSTVESSPTTSPGPRRPSTVSRPSGDAWVIFTQPCSIRNTRSAKSPWENIASPRRKR